jgi:hypothetical protein
MRVDNFEDGTCIVIQIPWWWGMEAERREREREMGEARWEIEDEE